MAAEVTHAFHPCVHPHAVPHTHMHDPHAHACATAEAAHEASTPARLMAYCPGGRALKSLWVLGSLYHFYTDHTGAGGPGIVEVVAYPPPKGSDNLPLHHHTREMESFVVLEGELAVRFGDQPARTYGAGSVIVQECGMHHTFYCAGSKPARFLALIFPPGLLKLFEEMGTPCDVPLGTIPATAVAPTPEQLRTFAERAPAYGITIEH